VSTDEKLDLMIAEIGAMRESLSDLRSRADKTDASLDAIREYILDFRGEAIRRFDQVEARLDMVIVTVQSFDARVPALTKAVLELQVRMEKSQRPAA